MYIIGINGSFYRGHDPSVTIVKDGRVTFACEEERLNRIKHSPGWMPVRSIKAALAFENITIRDVDFVVYYTNTYKDIENILKSFFNFNFGYCPPLKFCDHHLAHAASSYYMSGFKDSLILTLDNTGDSRSTLIGHAKDMEITTVKHITSDNSLGLFYGMLTQFLGFEMLSDEYKVMGLSAYGKPDVDFSKIIRPTKEGFELGQSSIKRDFHASQAPFVAQQHLFSEFWGKTFGCPPRLKGSQITEHYKNIAASGQRALENCAIRLLEIAAENNDSKNLSLAGGVALNCVMNYKLLHSENIKNIFIQPAAYDAGTSLGAALRVSIEEGEKIKPNENIYLGPGYDNESIKKALDLVHAQYDYHDNIHGVVAELITQGKIVGWFQGRMEWGPRALGNRSILADPRDPQMKDKINSRIKFREEFRPFAPAVLEEKAKKYFENIIPSPYMTITFPVISDEIPAVTHVNNTGRVQTINRQQNKMYYDMINEFYKMTGVACVLNTSLNVMGQPIVCTPLDAISTFWGTGMDAIAIGNYLVKK